MSHYTIDELIELWKREKLTAEQIVGQILQVLRAHELRLDEHGRRLPPTEGAVPTRHGSSKRPA